MSITLELDDELLRAARTAARERNQAVEAFVADVLRNLLLARSATGDVRDGIRLLPFQPGTPVVTHALVQQLLDETE